MHTLSYIPENITPDTRCIIMLHGVGSSESDLFGIHESLPADMIVYSLRGPFSLGMGGYAWYPVDFSSGKPIYSMRDVDQGYTEIVECISDITEKYGIKNENIYLMGFSQGAIMSYYALIHVPESIGGVIGLSGRLLVELQDFVRAGKDYSSKKVFIGHGRMDAMISIDAASVVQDFLESIRISVNRYTYNSGHTITSDELSDINTWLQHTHK